MKFKINGTVWTIKEVDKDNMKLNNSLGETDYTDQEIRLLKNIKNKERTLKHELMHVWLWEHGHSQKEDEDYNHESVCEIVACSNDFINEIVKKYSK